MRSTFNVSFFIRRDKRRKDGTCPILCRITVDGEETHFYTKVYAKESNWSVSANKFKGNNQESRRNNILLDDIKASLYRIYHEQQRFDVVTPAKVKNQFLGLEDSGETLLELFDKHNKDVEALVGISKSSATLQKYKVSRRRVAEFIKFKYKVDDIALRSINDMFLRDFEVFLLSQIKMSHNTMAKFMQFLKRM